MLQRLLAISAWVLASLLAPSWASAETVTNLQPVAAPTLSVSSASPIVTGTTVSFPVTIQNKHPYAVSNVSLAIQRIDHLYLAQSSAKSSVTVNGQALAGSYTSTPIQTTSYNKYVTIGASSSQTITLSISLGAISSAADFRIVATNRAGESLGSSPIMSVPSSTAGLTQPAVVIEEFTLSTASGADDSSAASPTHLPMVSLTVHNTSSQAQMVTPAITYFTLDQEIVGSYVAQQKFTPVTLTSGARQTFSEQLAGSFVAQEYQLQASILGSDGNELLPEKYASLIISGQSARIHNLILDPRSSNGVSGQVFASGSADNQTSLSGTLHVWVTDEAKPGQIIAESSQSLPTSINNSTIAIPFSITSHRLFGTTSVVVHAEILNQSKKSLDLVTVSTVLLPRFNTAGFILLVLTMILLLAAGIFLIYRLRNENFQLSKIIKHKKKVATALTVLGLLLLPFNTIPQVAQASETYQTTPISTNLSNFALNNTGIATGASVLGASAGSDAYSVVAKTVGGNSGGVALASIEVAPGWGKDWSFDQDLVSYAAYTTVSCNTPYTGPVPVPTYTDSNGYRHNFATVTTNDICSYYSKINYGVYGTYATTEGYTPYPMVRLPDSCTQGTIEAATNSCCQYILTGSSSLNTCVVVKAKSDNRNDTQIINIPVMSNPGPNCDISNLHYDPNVAYGSYSFLSAIPVWEPIGYTPSCYVHVPSVTYYNSDNNDRPLPLYGVPSDGTYHNFYKDFAYPAVDVTAQSDDLMPCQNDPAFTGKYNIDTTYDSGISSYLASKNVAYPNVQAYPPGATDSTATGYVVSEAMRSGSLRVYFAACVQPKANGAPGTAKIGFGAKSDQYKFTGGDHGADDPNAYARKLVNSWTFTHGSGYASTYDSNYIWGRNLTAGQRADRTCLAGSGGAGTDSDCYNEVYHANDIDGDQFLNLSWNEVDPAAAGSADSNSWTSYVQPLLQTCTQFVVSSKGSPYSGSSNPGLRMPANQGYASLIPALSASSFSAKYGRDCSAVPSISGSSSTAPTVTLSAPASVTEGSSILFTTTATNNKTLVIMQGNTILGSVSPVSGATTPFAAPVRGTYTFTAVACNAQADCATSTPVTVVVTAVSSASPTAGLRADKTDLQLGSVVKFTTTAANNTSLSIKEVKTPTAVDLGLGLPPHGNTSPYTPVSAGIHLYFAEACNGASLPCFDTLPISINVTTSATTSAVTPALLINGSSTPTAIAPGQQTSYAMSAISTGIPVKTLTLEYQTDTGWSTYTLNGAQTINPASTSPSVTLQIPTFTPTVETVYTYRVEATATDGSTYDSSPVQVTVIPQITTPSVSITPHYFCSGD